MGFSTTISAASVTLILGIGHADAKLQSLKDALQACARVPDSSARLTCFEDLAKSSSSGHAPSVASAPGPAAERTPVTASEQRAAVTAKRRKADDSGDPARQGYEAVVLRAWQSGSGDYYIALTNGEIWKSETRDKPRPVKEGESVQLRPGAIGSWFMEFKTLQRPAIRVNLLE
ncbi:MAG: hypothetical protein JSR98_19365 [Proteobacteria bacterium]|nr:hypothetical protein [Pseudomonadota bacterium]